MAVLVNDEVVGSRDLATWLVVVNSRGGVGVVEVAIDGSGNGRKMYGCSWQQC